MNLLATVVNGLRAIAYPINPDTPSIISGDGKPSTILVDLVSTKILMNLDNVDYSECHDGYEQYSKFAWKCDGVVVAGSIDYKTERYDDGKYRRTGKTNWAIRPQIKTDGKQHTLDDKEIDRLWKTMVKAGRLKMARDKANEEYRRQQQAVNAINALCERESDKVVQAKLLAKQALLKIPSKPMTDEEVLREQFGV